jgi:hypothetical protein
MGMVNRSVSELKGAQLDWAVAKAEGVVPENPEWMFWDGEPRVNWYTDDGERGGTVPLSSWGSPSSDWNMGGPIIDRERISFSVGDGVIEAECDNTYARAQTHLIAAMRAFVASKLGDEVEVPE